MRKLRSAIVLHELSAGHSTRDANQTSISVLLEPENANAHGHVHCFHIGATQFDIGLV